MGAKGTADYSTLPDSSNGAFRQELVPKQGPLGYLDQATALSEVLFGLIMTLTFTLSAGLIIEDEGRAGARELLIAVIGCNIAWGIIDAALYLVGQLFERGRVRKLEQAIRSATNRASAVAVVGTELDPLVGNVLEPREITNLYDRIAESVLSRSEMKSGTGLTRDDWLGGVISFVLVVVSCVPAAIPFLVMDDARLALRVSNGVLLALLFFTGYWWSRYTLGKPWVVGTIFLVIGLVLVFAAIALGG
ncbi:MAG: VIT family protein [Povalibacter sp.]